MPSAGADHLIARFKSDLDALTGQGGDAACFGVAVSGGPDSMGLLWLASRAFSTRVFAATVDHGLRPEARDEAEMVAAWCANEGIEHAMLAPEQPIAGNIQSTARAVRYALLENWRKAQNIDWLLTAHHADDQLETLLMRLNRSSGVGGLAGVRARNGHVLRPLLGWRRVELMEIVTAHALPHVHDPSNEDMRFDRVAMRHKLAQVDWLDPVAASRSAAACAEAEEALIWLVDELVQRHVHVAENGIIALDTYDFPREILRRLVMRMIALAEPTVSPPRGEAIDQAVVQLLRGKRAGIGKWVLTGGERWTLSPEPSRKAP